MGNGSRFSGDCIHHYAQAITPGEVPMGEKRSLRYWSYNTWNLGFRTMREIYVKTFRNECFFLHGYSKHGFNKVQKYFFFFFISFSSIKKEIDESVISALLLIIWSNYLRT